MAIKINGVTVIADSQAITTTSTISATGNITGGNLSVVGTITAAGVNTGSSPISTTGNVTAGNVSATNLTGTLLTASQPNITSVGTLTSLNSGAISSSGNVTGANILTGGTVSATGSGYFGNGLSVVGNIDATGNINYVNVTDLVVGDPLIYIGANNTSNLVDLGIVAAATAK